MSCLRYSDDFTDWPEWDMATLDARWAYVCLVQACSRGKYWDGRLPKKKAMAALVAQLDDPQQALERLGFLSLVHKERASQVIVIPRIHEFVPPPHVRTSTARTKVRVRRHRAHQSGDHSQCLETCADSPLSQPVTADVTGDVTRYIGTGRDGKSTFPTAEGRSRVTTARARAKRIATAGPAHDHQSRVYTHDRARHGQVVTPDAPRL